MGRQAVEEGPLRGRRGGPRLGPRQQGASSSQGGRGDVDKRGLRGVRSVQHPPGPHAFSSFSRDITLESTPGDGRGGSGRR